MDAMGVLGGCRIVVTRPAGQAEELAEPLRARGADVRVRPLVRVEPPADPQPLAQQLRELASFDLVVFTSANAVRACAGERDWPEVACVGAATARCARELGLPVSFVPATFTAESLGAELVARGGLAGRRVLWPRASAARDTIVDALTAAGAAVVDVEAYRTVPDAAAAALLARELEESPADVLVMTSPSAVQVYAKTAGVPRCAVAVIGTVTAERAEAAGMRVAVVPHRHDGAGLVAALESWYVDAR